LGRLFHKQIIFLDANIEDVFAGGDIVTSSATVISTMGQVIMAVKSIDEYIKEKILEI
jgi:glutamate synthase (NADPH/NADH) small chain